MVIIANITHGKRQATFAVFDIVCLRKYGKVGIVIRWNEAMRSIGGLGRPL